MADISSIARLAGWGGVCLLRAPFGGQGPRRRLARSRACLQGMVLVSTLVAACAMAQTRPAPLVEGYPSRTLRMLVSSAAGGANDITARAVGQKLTERTGQPVVIDNRAGGNGVIAMDTLAQAAPDGYTLLSGSNSLLLNGVQKKVAYDVRTAFDVAVMMTVQPYVLAIVPALGIAGLKELVAHARSHPGTLFYGTGGVGSVNHLGFELLQAGTGISLVHVPYKGSAGVYPDLMSGRIHLIFSSGVSMAPYLRSGKLRALGVGSTVRMPAFADIPTIAESGLPGFELGNAYYLFVPAGVPQAIQAALNRSVGQIVHLPELREKFAADGAQPGLPLSPAELKGAFVREYRQWDELIRRTGIQLGE